MNIKIRIIATLLAVLTVLGSMVIAVGAADVDDEGKAIAKKYLDSGSVFRTPQEKLDSMKLMLKNSKYELYVDEVSGEIALHEPGTKNTLFSNPYDVASSKGSSLFSTGSNNVGTKEQLLLSQVIVNYLDNGSPKQLFSFADAAMRGQIKVSKIKSGVRVEYSIGREAVRQLVPRQLSKASFEQNILKPLQQAVEEEKFTEFDYNKFLAFYTLYDPNKEGIQQFEIDTMLNRFEYLKESDANALYELAPDITATELDKLESQIEKFCSESYSFEQMDMDHEETKYEAKDEKSPVFKLALEYSLDNTGLDVRVPCNGLQYDTATYTLENISILPYMGAGNTKNDGYNFYPDGSGSLFDFNLNKNEIVRGKIYGTDYAYHQISGKYQKSIRVPVYGTVAEEIIYSYGYNKYNSDGTVESYPNIEVSNTVMSLDEIKKILSASDVVVTKDPEAQDADGNYINQKKYTRGYVAIIESGESLADLETYYAGALSDYATMSNYFNPKPKDSYDIADSISVTSSSVWTVVSKRKYTGSIQIHYQMLGDNTYDASWLGMAEAYRDYLVNADKIQRLTDEDVEADIPLYMEVFGALKTQQTIATLPVNVMTPLTTFDDIITMYQELSAKGVNNINFKMTGFANGGMYSTVPYKLKWENAVGGKSGFTDLVEEAGAINAADDDRHIGLYPDFDFAYANRDGLFDSLNMKKDGIKTIDNRYTSKRQYSATQQKYVSFFQLAVSPSRYNKFYEKLMSVYSKYGLNTMSVASLGTALNSDFDEDEPFNREDCKDFTIQAFEDLSKNYSLMTEGGNAYSWAYVDHILDVDLDSSRYVKSCCSVPFMGAVLHGYVQFAGAPLNEEGDTDYALLKAIENGAGMYFILSSQNTHELKEDPSLSQYYSIRYDIWRDDVVGYYNELNSALKDVQTSLIIDHKFLNYNNYLDINGNGKADPGEYFATERVLDADELDKDIRDELDNTREETKDQVEQDNNNKIASVADAMVALYDGVNSLEKIVAQANILFAALKTEVETNYDLDKSPLAAFLATLGADKCKTDYFSNIGKMWNAYEYLEYQYTLADEKLVELQAAYDFLAESDDVQQYQLDLAAAQLAAATNYLAGARSDLNDSYDALLANWESGLMQIQVNLGIQFNDFVAVYDYLNGVYLVEKIEEYNTANGFDVSFDVDSVKKEYAYVAPNKGTTGDSAEAETDSARYQVNNNNVVSVTYGDIVEGEKVVKKIFILNYNSYAVRVTYNNIVYTVAAGGYVIVPSANA